MLIIMYIIIKTEMSVLISCSPQRIKKHLQDNCCYGPEPEKLKNSSLNENNFRCSGTDTKCCGFDQNVDLAWVFSFSSLAEKEHQCFAESWYAGFLGSDSALSSPLLDG